MISCTASTYQGDYGDINHKADFLLHVRLESMELPKTTQARRSRMIVVVDTSGSMKEEMNALKISLLALQQQMHKFPHTDLYVYTFNTTVEEFCTPTVARDTKTFEARVQSLSAGGCTNLDEAVRTPFTLISKEDNVLTQIVFLTDGHPDYVDNLLSQQQSQQPQRRCMKTASEFSAFMLQNRTFYTQVTCIGLGDHYNLQIVEAIGRLVHINRDNALESISYLWGTLLQEAASTRFVECQILAPPELVPIVGEPQRIGIMPTGRVYHVIYRGATQKHVDQAQGKVQVCYVDIDARKMESIRAHLTYQARDVPDQAKQLYHSRMLGDLLGELQQSQFSSALVAHANRVLKIWEADPLTRDTCALHLKQALQKAGQGSSSVLETASTSADLSRQYACTPSSSSSGITPAAQTTGLTTRTAALRISSSSSSSM